MKSPVACSSARLRRSPTVSQRLLFSRSSTIRASPEAQRTPRDLRSRLAIVGFFRLAGYEKHVVIVSKGGRAVFQVPEKVGSHDRLAIDVSDVLCFWKGPVDGGESPLAEILRLRLYGDMDLREVRGQGGRH